MLISYLHTLLWYVGGLFPWLWGLCTLLWCARGWPCCGSHLVMWVGGAWNWTFDLKHAKHAFYIHWTTSLYLSLMLFILGECHFTRGRGSSIQNTHTLTCGAIPSLPLFLKVSFSLNTIIILQILVNFNIPIFLLI